MLMHITDSKHEWNTRRIVELQEEIRDAEKQLEITEGFWARRKASRKINKLNKQLIKHGEEVLAYELQELN